jgi:hypothetical protein
MYVILQTTQAPLQCNWCGDGLSVVGSYQIANTAGTSSNVYISSSGDSPSVYTNQKGTLSYTFQKIGPAARNITTSGTALISTYLTDSVASSTPVGSKTNYTLTITDSNNGQKYIFLNSVTWGLV